MKRYLSPIFLLALIIAAGAEFVPAQSGLNLRIEDVMTAQEMKETGLEGESQSQKQALNKWLNQYTLHVVGVIRGSSKAICSSTIESTLSGELNGWDGETIFNKD
jgi:hypothetical protein